MKLGAFIGPKLFHAAMRDLEKAGKIVADRENIRLPDHRVSLQDDQESLRREIAEWYRQAGLAPPSLREVTEKLAQHKSQIGGILNVMLKNGTLTTTGLTNGAALGTSTTANSWVSQTTLSIDGVTALTIKVGAYTITLSGGVWEANDLPELKQDLMEETGRIRFNALSIA